MKGRPVSPFQIILICENDGSKGGHSLSNEDESHVLLLRNSHQNKNQVAVPASEIAESVTGCFFYRGRGVISEVRQKISCKMAENSQVQLSDLTLAQVVDVAT